ncbi:unnamed protein product, partial [Heterobilharzia americana]
FLIALSYLFRTYPEFISVRSLPLDDKLDCLRIANTFYNLGFLIAERNPGLMLHSHQDNNKSPNYYYYYYNGVSDKDETE